MNINAGKAIDHEHIAWAMRSCTLAHGTGCFSRHARSAPLLCSAIIKADKTPRQWASIRMQPSARQRYRKPVRQVKTKQERRKKRHRFHHQTEPRQQEGPDAIRPALSLSTNLFFIKRHAPEGFQRASCTSDSPVGSCQWQSFKRCLMAESPLVASSEAKSPCRSNAYLC